MNNIPIFIRCTNVNDAAIWVNILTVSCMKRLALPHGLGFTILYHTSESDITKVRESPEAILLAVQHVVTQNMIAQAEANKPPKPFFPGEPSAN